MVGHGVPHNSLRFLKVLFVYLFLLVTQFRLFGGVAHISPLHDRVQSIPFDDRVALERFFKRLFFHGDFAYTLFGQKPMGSIDYNMDLLRLPRLYQEHQEHLLLMALDNKDWKIWEKYQILFPMKTFALIKIEKATCFGFLLVHKKQSLEVIKENLALFQSIAGEQLGPKKLLQMLCNGQFSYSYPGAVPLADYYKALGFLYGYGHQNVQFFARREELIQSLIKLPIDFESLPSDVVECLAMNDSSEASTDSHNLTYKTTKSLISELQSLINQSSLINSDSKNQPFLPIKKSLFFGVKNHSDTETIINTWDNLDSLILNIGARDNFLETILGILTLL